MSKSTIRSIVIGALALPAIVFGAAGTAGADHVNVPKPPSPPWTEQRDGLTWCYREGCMNWDKTNHYVCTTDSPAWVLCDGIMIAVRVLPPLNIGDHVPHHLIP